MEQPASSVDASSYSDQSAEEKALVDKVEKLWQKARKTKKPKMSRWQENFEFYLGRQWPYRRPSYRHSEVVNLIFSAVESVVPILNDNRPQISFLPEDIDDRDLADALTKLADSEWTRKGWSFVLADIIKQGLILGCGVGSMEYDPNLNSGLGDIVFENKDPWTIYPAARAEDINDGSCPYFIEARTLPTEEAKAMFPELADQIKGSVTSGIPQRYERAEFDTTLNANAIRSNEASDDGVSAFTDIERRKEEESLLIKCWIDEDTVEEVEQLCKDAFGNPIYETLGVQKKETIYKKKYPNGRLIITIDGLLAQDGPNPYDDGKYPYVRFIDYQIPNEFWGMSEVEQLKSPQRMINRLLSFMMDTVVLMGNPIWVTDMGAIDTDQVTNQPGLIVEKTPGADVHREPGMGLPANFLQVYQLCISAFDRIFGSGEISQGTAQPGITSGVALDSLQEAAQTRIRQKARNLEKFLNELGTMYLSRVMQFYSTERVVTLSEDGSNAITSLKQFKFKIEAEPENTGMYTATVQELIPQENAPAMAGAIKTFKTKGIFDVRSTVGSNLPFAKRAKADTAMKLFQLGVLTPRRLLKDLDYPNSDQIADELEKNQQAAAQAAAQQPKGK